MIDFEVETTRRQWLNEDVFELGFRRPRGFNFIPGQKIRLGKNGISRQYTLINAPDSSELTLCVRHLQDGQFTPLLARSQVGDIFSMSAAQGFFTYRSNDRRAVFVATGTGIAPFLAYARAGIQGSLLLHGAAAESELLYRNEVEKSVGVYVPCLTGSGSKGHFWSGRVTSYLERSLEVQEYDFYLCGNGNMIRDAVKIIDSRLSSSRLFLETFF
ncbi:MAG: FAD-binding oxidoreductase [Desulfocapsaceae bacterium]|nr:FAD-binding oxidoreductase [Desulfocapsaceae bacterium]